MKKVVLGALLLCGICVSSVAQEKGDFWVGGSGLLSGKNHKEVKGTINFEILPEFGYQFGENWGVGIQLGYTHNQIGLNATDRAYFNGFKVAPFVKYSYLKGGIGSLFLDGGISYGYSKQTVAEDPTNTFGVGIKPGVAVNVSEKISLIGKFGEFGYRLEKTDKVKNHDAGAKLTLDQIELGIIYKF